jgi:SAM-dependent methyltransferase
VEFDDGDEYQAQFDALVAEGFDVHGEADFVRALGPRSVLDAGCGTGRVARELARHGIDVVGADISPGMLLTARELAPELAWIESDLASLDLGRSFDVVVMAGNVLLFTEPGTQPDVVAGCARHLARGGALVAGFQLDRGYSLVDYDDACHEAGLTMEERFATWDRDPYETGGSYAVSVHRRADVSAR